MKLGRFSDQDPESEAKAAAMEEEERVEAEAIPVSARCEVILPGALAKRGTVMFVGESITKPLKGVGIIVYCIK